MNYFASSPFSSGTEYEIFKYNYCEKCTHHYVREDGFPEFPHKGGCPIEDKLECARFDIEEYPKEYIRKIVDYDESVIKHHHCMLFTERREYDS